MNLENLDVVAMDAAEMVDVDGGFVLTTSAFMWICIFVIVAIES